MLRIYIYYMKIKLLIVEKVSSLENILAAKIYLLFVFYNDILQTVSVNSFQKFRINNG